MDFIENNKLKNNKQIKKMEDFSKGKTNWGALVMIIVFNLVMMPKFYKIMTEETIVPCTIAHAHIKEEKPQGISIGTENSLEIYHVRAVVYVDHVYESAGVLFKHVGLDEETLKAHYAEGLMLSCKYNYARSSPIIATSSDHWPSSNNSHYLRSDLNFGDLFDFGVFFILCMIDFSVFVVPFLETPDPKVILQTKKE